MERFHWLNKYSVSQFTITSPNLCQIHHDVVMRPQHLAGQLISKFPSFSAPSSLYSTCIQRQYSRRQQSQITHGWLPSQQPSLLLSSIWTTLICNTWSSVGLRCVPELRRIKVLTSKTQRFRKTLSSSDLYQPRHPSSSALQSIQALLLDLTYILVRHGHPLRAYEG